MVYFFTVIATQLNGITTLALQQNRKIDRSIYTKKLLRLITIIKPLFSSKNKINQVFRLCFLLIERNICCLVSNRIRIILAVSPRIWRPTLNHTNDIHVSAFIKFVQRFSPLNTRSGVCIMSILFN